MLAEESARLLNTYIVSQYAISVETTFQFQLFGIRCISPHADILSRYNKEYHNEKVGLFPIVLPIPEYRISTPRICIEHYYSDSEIKTEFMCADRIKRRLYMGNEFDQYGRAINLDRFCVNREACGSGSIRIISGSGKRERVISLTKNDGKNYALSKALFVEHVCNNELQNQ